ncbi:DIOX_N domain-containing protein [Cephalotus follicularis]|uniref:DIOX_N domain-containing protein n=1 Tax=Cephalotus follicularis TaxID=3775 RepID=A0A1Q3BBI4_CEPFO|nr:DIOX_N domain-containing protein [Cephalotus follicularis]
MVSDQVGCTNYGGSLPVDNVQALASGNLKNIPERYVRHEVEHDEVYTDESLQIPVIDMSKLASVQIGHDNELAKLHQACKDWGFFQLLINVVHEDVIDKMKKDVEDFFKLPLEEKMTWAQLPNSIEGYGQAFVVSEEQKLDWGDMLFLLTRHACQRNMRLWPTTPFSFSATLEKYSSELQRVTICLMRFLAMNLGLDPEKLASFFEEWMQGVRMNYYPPCVHARGENDILIEWHQQS